MFQSIYRIDLVDLTEEHHKIGSEGLVMAFVVSVFCQSFKGILLIQLVLV